MSKIYPILLAGGSGKRLWPLSRKSYPKQFSKLIGDKTLFQESALRLTSSEQLEFASHITLTSYDYRFIIGEQLQAVGIDPGPILIEPEAKNTAPAILTASLFAQAEDPEAILLVAPSDHVITDTTKFHNAVRTGLDHVNAGKMLTFGISPKYPETGYGYLELAKDSLDEFGTSKVINFVEKPDHERAKQMLEAGNFLWNAGILLFKALDMIQAFEFFSPDSIKHVKEALDSAEVDLGFLRLNKEPWAKLKDISIDYEIMEKATNLLAVPYLSKWSDLGGWDAVWAESDRDKSGSAVSDGAHAIECTNSLLRSESSNQTIVGLGLESIIAVAMPDAVLVANKNRAQDIKEIVDYLQKNNIRQADTLPIDHRPWGWFESLVLGKQFQVKRICVKPGAALSLQSHKHRSEHWIVVEGTAKVLIENKIKLVGAGESVYVPLGAVHRMENTGTVPMVLIEVQIGSYLGEDDIIRYDDLYKRN